MFKRKFFVLTLIALLLLTACSDMTGVDGSDPEEDVEESVIQITGIIDEVASTHRSLTFTEPQEGLDTIALDDSTRIFLPDESEADVEDFEPGMTLEVEGYPVIDEQQLLATRINIVEIPEAVAEEELGDDDSDVASDDNLEENQAEEFALEEDADELEAMQAEAEANEAIEEEEDVLTGGDGSDVDGIVLDEYPMPDAEVAPIPWENVPDNDEVLVENIEWETYTTTFAGDANYTFEYPADWSLYADAENEIVQVQNIERDPDPAPTDFAKFEMVRLEEQPVSSLPIELDALYQVTAAGQPALLHYASEEPNQTRTLVLFWQADEGQWMSVSGYVTLPERDAGSLERYSAVLLQMFESLAVAE